MIKISRLCITALATISLCFSAFAGENDNQSDSLSGYSIVTIKIHPQNNQIIYLGTIQNGMYRSIDGGNSWTHIDTDTVYTTLRVIEINPLNPDVIYASTVYGVYKSIDGGINWHLLNTFNNPRNEFRGLAINPIDTNIIFTGGPWVNLRKSIDGGQTWYDKGYWPIYGVEDYAIDPGNPNIMYFASGAARFGKAIFRSEDMGESWFNIQNNLDSAGYGTDIAIDPADPKILYFARNTAVDSATACLAKSTDSGKSWYDITPPGLHEAYIPAVRVSQKDHSTIYACSFADGIFKSIDGGKTWEQRNNGLQDIELKAMEIDYTTGTIYLGTYYNGIYRSFDDGITWVR